MSTPQEIPYTVSMAGHLVRAVVCVGIFVVVCGGLNLVTSWHWGWNLGLGLWWSLSIMYGDILYRRLRKRIQ